MPGTVRNLRVRRAIKTDHGAATTVVRRLLVPLADRVADEATLQTIVGVARNAGCTVRLPYVRPLPGVDADGTKAASQTDEERRRLEAEGSRYLDAVAASFGDLPVERAIRLGDLDATILDEAAAWRADLVALSAGDRTWLSRAVRTGSAAKAFRKTGIPALLYTPSPS